VYLTIVSFQPLYNIIHQQKATERKQTHCSILQGYHGQPSNRKTKIAQGVYLIKKNESTAGYEFVMAIMEKRSVTAKSSVIFSREV
jgi:hypothetical protein